MKIRRLIFAVILVLIVAVIYRDDLPDGHYAAIRTWIGGDIPRIGEPAPEFTLQSIQGKTYRVAATDGKPYVINFFASWCGPCRQEAPDLVKLNDKYGHRLHLYSVNVTNNDQIRNVKKFMQQYGIDFPVLLDQDHNNAVLDLYHVTHIPTSFFVNGQGVIVDMAIGRYPTDKFNQKFTRLMEVGD